MTRTLAIPLLLAAVTASGCTTMKTGRARIVQAPAVCQDVTVPVYFDRDVAAITPDGRRLIAAEANRAKGCTVDSVRVIGLTDAVGTPEANLELSKKRAASVTDAIIRAGLPPASFELESLGQAGAVTPQGAAPMRRRADIILKLSKPK